MKSRSLSQQWRGLSGFWKFVYFNVFLFMPWSILLVLLGIWHIDDRIDDICDSVESQNKNIANLYSTSTNCERYNPIDTIERYKQN